MKSLRTALMGAGFLLTAGFATTAAASTTLTVSDVGVQSYNTVSGVPIVGSAISTAIEFQIGTLSGTLPNLPNIGGAHAGDTIIVFCDDLGRNVYIGSGGYQYEVGEVTTNSLGSAISMQVSNELGQLADIGRSIYYSPDPSKSADLTSVQDAIWNLEYNGSIGPYSGESAAVEQQIAGVSYHGGGYALGLIGLNNDQSQVLGSVPEPASWLMMLLGAGIVGAGLRQTRRKATAFAAG